MNDLSVMILLLLASKMSASSLDRSMWRQTETASPPNMLFSDFCYSCVRLMCDATSNFRERKSWLSFNHADRLCASDFPLQRLLNHICQDISFWHQIFHPITVLVLVRRFLCIYTVTTRENGRLRFLENKTRISFS